MALTPDGMAAGFSLSTFATGFPNSGGIGPLGIAFPDSGGVLVTDFPGNIRLFPTDTDGQDASLIPPSQNYGGLNAFGLDKSGSQIYMTQRNNGALVQVNDDGTFERTVLGVPVATGIITNPANGHLFISLETSPGQIWDFDPVHNTSSVFKNNLLIPAQRA
jgi:DNA-binding beta-propeller fold protein YncE